jgi:hypothetical protein
VPLLILPILISSVSKHLKLSFILLAIFASSVSLSRTTLVFVLIQIVPFLPLFLSRVSHKSLLVFVALLIPGILSLDWTYFVWKIKSLSLSDSSGSTSGYVRIMEALNIFHTVSENVLGRGLGGYTTDNFAPFMHNVIGKDAYSLEDIRAHRIYKPHNQFLWLLLKFGLIVPALSSIIFTIRLLKTSKHFRIIAFTLILLFFKSFSQQLLILYGLLFFVLVDEIDLHKGLSSTSYSF